MFTFLTISYNHEKYIIEHLESIKYQILNYGKNIEFEYILCDDNSLDKTIKIAATWLELNKYLFKKILLLKNEVNQGVVRNIIKGISEITSDRFKLLAGDDLFYKNNIFEIDERCDVVITPVIEFSDTIKMKRVFKNYNYLLIYKNKTIFEIIQNKGNIISAPGVFIKKYFYNSPDYKDFISQFKWIEDLPTWYYLFKRDKNIHYQVSTKPYILRRIECGISTNKNNNKNIDFTIERDAIFKVYEIKNKKINKSSIKFKILNKGLKLYEKFLVIKNREIKLFEKNMKNE